MQKLAPGRISQGATTLERPGLKVTLVTVEETKAMTMTIEDKLNPAYLYE